MQKRNKKGRTIVVSPEAHKAITDRVYNSKGKIRNRREFINVMLKIDKNA